MKFNEFLQTKCMHGISLLISAREFFGDLSDRQKKQLEVLEEVFLYSDFDETITEFERDCTQCDKVLLKNFLSKQYRLYLRGESVYF